MPYSEKEERRVNKYLQKLALALPRWIRKKIEAKAVLIVVNKEGQIEVLCDEQLPDQEKFHIGKKVFTYIDANPHEPFTKVVVQ